VAQAPSYIKNADTSNITSEASLEQARKMAKEFFDLEQEIESLEEQLSTKNKEKLELQQRKLPELFNNIQIDRIGLPEDNVDVVIGPYYKANISTEWPEDRRKKAFDVLEEIDGDEIIRAVLSVEFNTEEYDDAKELFQFIRTQWPKANQHPMKLIKAVNWATLTSFIREYTEDESTDPLTDEQKEALGATIGVIAKIKKRKTK